MPRANQYSHLIPGFALCALTAAPLHAMDDRAPDSISATGSTEALQLRVQELERELAAAREELAKTKAPEETPQGDLSDLEDEVAATEPPASDKIAIHDSSGGTLKIGGAIRSNYAWGDYGASTGAPSRASGDGGNMELDVFRINLDYENGGFIGKAEYRFYDGYNMLHTGWLGYNFENGTQVQVGVNRVPFGPGPYGVSQSWFFDQHYYVGLADDMDLGIKYSMPLGNWTLDLAYYYSDEGNWAGASKDSARFSYDIVNESGNGYEERNQFNVRGIYSFEDVAIPSEVGFSLQYGELESKGTQDDGDHYAASVHMVNKYNNFTLASQLTKYKYDIDAYTPFTSTTAPTPTEDVIQFGAFDFPSLAATEGWIPAVSLSYYQATPSIKWLDYVIPYVEYSSIIKDESSFNDSDLATLGAAWGSGGWYIYTEVAYSTGNEFVGGETTFGDRLGANADDDSQTRYNINLGYYF
jgi:hypothetical protein